VGGVVVDPEGAVVVDPEGAVVVDPEGAVVVDAPEMAAVEGEVPDVAVALVAAETAELIPTPSPAAPPKMPRASRVFRNGVCMVTSILSVAVVGRRSAEPLS